MNYRCKCGGWLERFSGTVYCLKCSFICYIDLTVYYTMDSSTVAQHYYKLYDEVQNQLQISPDEASSIMEI